jgi:V/A-type H+-transporting ATPase subunit A
MGNNSKTTGRVAGIIANLVIVEVDGSVAQNEICYIQHAGIPLMAEVIKVIGKNVYVQVFESTRGLRVGTAVEFEGHMLEVTLGPGILSRNYDGLQNDLDKMEGVFLRKGDYTDPLNREVLWDFKPLANVNDEVEAGDWLGEVQENGMPHKIMVPFKMNGTFKVKSMVSAGQYRVDNTIAVLIDSSGVEHTVTMVQKWPVKMPIRAYAEKPRPFKLLETGVRCIDTLNPIVEGGTGFIPGPFGTGKTVLQHAISKQAEADIVIIAACGERANEVVEIFYEFPELEDPRTGKKLIERTTIIANTSNMPVAAREASVYTAMTLGEYYRSMGLRVLLMADSTSRWAQALREMSNRLEELPGPDAFPMDLSAIISNFYSRAGYVYLNNGEKGSITFIGTVSPAGGNLKEPVTESTRKAARCFYGLSQPRADSKRYPAIDPIDSYSKYLEYPEVQEYLEDHVGEGWLANVTRAKDILLRGKEAKEQINILGDDGVPIDFHERFWRSELIDFVILQQDAFDKIDSSTPLTRQKYMLGKVLELTQHTFQFKAFEEVQDFFKNIINQFRQMNYSTFESN